VVWPSIKEHTLIHDEYFGVFDATPFPPYGRLPRGHHVGMNVSALPDEKSARRAKPRIILKRPAKRPD